MQEGCSWCGISHITSESTLRTVAATPSSTRGGAGRLKHGGHRRPGRCLKVWPPFHLVDARNHDPVPVASGTRQETHIHQETQRCIRVQGAGIEPSRLPKTSTPWRWLQDRVGRFDTWQNKPPTHFHASYASKVRTFAKFFNKSSSADIRYSPKGKFSTSKSRSWPLWPPRASLSLSPNPPEP